MGERVYANRKSGSGVAIAGIIWYVKPGIPQNYLAYTSFFVAVYSFLQFNESEQWLPLFLVACAMMMSVYLFSQIFHHTVLRRYAGCALASAVSSCLRLREFYWFVFINTSQHCRRYSQIMQWTGDSILIANNYKSIITARTKIVKTSVASELLCTRELLRSNVRHRFSENDIFQWDICTRQLRLQIFNSILKRFQIAPRTSCSIDWRNRIDCVQRIHCYMFWFDITSIWPTNLSQIQDENLTLFIITIDFQYITS